MLSRRREGRRNRRPIIASAIAVALAFALASAAHAAAGGSERLKSSTDRSAPDNQAAGYELVTPVRTMGARWLVPTILAGAPDCEASTSITAQSINSAGPWVQVGTFENCDPGRSQGRRRSDYEGFWADADSPWPYDFMKIGSGDRVSVGLVQAEGGWTVTFDDLTRHAAVRLTTGYGGNDPFGEGFWLQTDPVTSSNVPLDYPRLSQVRITRLALNGKPPRRLDLNEQNLLTRTVRETPSSVSGDAFTIVSLR